MCDRVFVYNFDFLCGNRKIHKTLYLSLKRKTFRYLNAAMYVITVGFFKNRLKIGEVFTHFDALRLCIRAGKSKHKS